MSFLGPQRPNIPDQTAAKGEEELTLLLPSGDLVFSQA